jgi:hypothetical protein
MLKTLAILCILAIILSLYVYHTAMEWTVIDKMQLSRRIRNSLREAIKKEIDYDASQADSKILVDNEQFNSVFDEVITQSLTDCMVDEIAANYGKYTVQRYLSFQNTKDINKGFIAFVENTKNKCGEDEAEKTLHARLGLTHVVSPTPPIPAIIAVKFF